MGDTAARDQAVELGERFEPAHGAAVSVDSWLSSGALELIDAWAARTQPRAIFALPDAWTSVGGSQYLDSPAVGRYLTYLADDIIEEVEGRIPLADGAGRIIIGHSSGGLGAYNLLTHRPGTLRAVGPLAADAMFEGVHLATYPEAARRLMHYYDGDWATVASTRHGHSSGPDAALADQWMLAHAYSRSDAPEPLFHGPSYTIHPDVWNRWAGFDPVRRAPGDAASLELLDTAVVIGGVA